jgi:hypothetical protein
VGQFELSLNRYRCDPGLQLSQALTSALADVRAWQKNKRNGLNSPIGGNLCANLED